MGEHNNLACGFPWFLILWPLVAVCLWVRYLHTCNMLGRKASTCPTVPSFKVPIVNEDPHMLGCKLTLNSRKSTMTSWWLNQPMNKKYSSKWLQSSPIFGVNIKNILKPPPRQNPIICAGKKCVSSASAFPHFWPKKKIPNRKICRASRPYC